MKTTTKRLTLAALGLLGATLAFSGATALAATIHVPADQPTIQGAVDVASPGDTILVGPGTYGGGIVINKAGLKLKAVGLDGEVEQDGDREQDGEAEGDCEGGALGAVKIAGDGSGVPKFGITVIANNVTIQGFEISGFSGVHDASGIFVGGVFAGDTANPADGAVITCNNIHDNGNGIYLWQSNGNKIQHNLIHDSKDVDGDEGTGILLFTAWDNASATLANAAGRSGKDNGISQNLVYNNDRLGIFAGACTYPYCDSGPQVNVDITGTRIEHNEAYGNGAKFTTEAIGLLNAHGGVIAHNKVHDNHLLGLYVNYSDNVTVEDNSVKMNPYSGILVQGSTEVSLENNKVSGSAYHGISISSSKRIVVENNEANKNSMATAGYSGIRISGSQDLAVSENRADNNGRGIRVTGSTGGAFTKNSAHGNAVFDLDWDATGTFTFVKNKAGTANPSKAAWAAK